eukprot:4462438-Pleurochrysis_carterae.AAC.1
MWIPSHVGIVPNIIADSVASKEHGVPPAGMITSLLSKQVKSRPVIYGRKVQGRTELADAPIYWEVRQRGKTVIRNMHKPPEGGDRCEGEVAKGLTSITKEQDGNTEWDMELADIIATREMETFVHGIRNGEIVGRPANERRMKHATREGNKPSYWTYLKVNGCRGCQKQEEEETIHHVISGRCQGVGKKVNSKYRGEMRGILQKYLKLMRDKHNNEGVVQAEKALRALEHTTGPHMNQGAREEEERALRQVVSGIIPEWHETCDKKRETIQIVKLWTVYMMNWARIQMKQWMAKKNENRAQVQRRWDNRGMMKCAFSKWRSLIHRVHRDTDLGQIHKE